MPLLYKVRIRKTQQNRSDSYFGAYGNFTPSKVILLLKQCQLTGPGHDKKLSLQDGCDGCYRLTSQPLYGFENTC